MVNKYKMLLMICSIFIVQMGKSQSIDGKDIEINWKPSPSYDPVKNIELILKIKNVGNQQLELHNWELFFNSMFPVIDTTTSTYRTTDLKGNLFKIEFLKNSIAPKDSLVIKYKSQYPIPGISTMPNGFYLRNKVNNKNVVNIDNVSYEHIKISAEQNIAFLNNLYERNAMLTKKADEILIFPTPKNIKRSSGYFSINRILNIHGNKEDYDLFNRELKKILVVNHENNSTASDVQLVRNENIASEAYNLYISKNAIKIEYATNKGLFYALQSIKSLHKGASNKSQLPCLEVHDEPRYAYRGFMMDIARNFRDKSIILKYLDLMAEYKLNVFHLHLIDDEAWRIEISGLPELTDVGSRRSPNYQNGEGLLPAYGSGIDDKKRFLTRQDFIEILRYAHDRNIQVVPEVETPGHARAAIKSMEYRFNNFMKLGNKMAAEEFLLHDPEDKSVYNTAQNFVDNVMNPALPSVYKFVDKVITEFKSMYNDAGVPFSKISLGGDEVPAGVWEKSPKIQNLMKEEGLANVYQVWTYYINKINTICLAHGLQMAGWEEVGMVNQGNGMVVNPTMANKQNMQLDVWNNIIGGGQDDLVYRLANAGYPTVLISASNTYFDMMWDTTFEEPGLKWATYADLYHSYSLFPEDYFANIHTYEKGALLNKDYISKLTRITEKGRSNFLGIKGGTFAETLLKDENLDYMVFPRFFALVERAWSPRRDYESESTFNKGKFDADYVSFNQRIGNIELPSLADNVKYRLPRVGLKLSQNKLYANTEYPGYKIYYTNDNSTVTLGSKEFDVKNGININKGEIIKAAVVDQSGRIGLISTYEVK